MMKKKIKEKMMKKEKKGKTSTKRKMNMDWIYMTADVYIVT